MDPNENDHRQLTPGDRNRAPHISPPVIGGQTTLLTNHGLRTNRGMSHYNLLPPRLLPDQSIPAPYRLRYINMVNNPTYTTKPVRDNNGDPIRVEMYDSCTRSRVSLDCSLSSAKVTISVLDADFWKNRVNWSRSEFVQNVLKGREGKDPILIGRSRTIQLENGVGTFENIVFNDNSRWTKCGFRLGVMVEGDGEEGYLNGERVQEGVSEPFQVRDRRTEASRKPDILKLTHGVKSIKKIGKVRASLLEKKNINTVEDFLNLYCNDEAAPREILGIKSESDQGWKSMVEHVMQCADEYHAKCNVVNSSSQPCQDFVHPMERNMPLSTNGGRLVVGSGSSEPNPSENDRIEGDMPAINWDCFPMWYQDHAFELLIDSLFNENGDSMQPTNTNGFPLPFGLFGGGSGSGSGGAGGSGN